MFIFSRFLCLGSDRNLSTRPVETSAVLLLAFIISAAFMLWSQTGEAPITWRNYDAWNMFLGVFLWVLTYYLTITIIIKCSSSFYLIIWYNYFSFWLIVLTIIKRFFSFYLSDLSRFCEWILSEERQLSCGEFMRNRAPVTSGCIWIFSVCLTCWLWAGPCLYFVLSDVEKYFNIKVYRRECAHETKVCVCVCQLVVTVEKVEILSWSHACLWMWSFQMSIYE